MVEAETRRFAAPAQPIGRAEPTSGQVNLTPFFKRISPLVDAGFKTPEGGLPSGSFDGGPRLVGPRVDMGAYELDILFA